MNLEERIVRMRTYHREGRMIRHSWGRGILLSDGREKACLLATFSLEVAEAMDAAACPPDAMPPWLAHLTPYLDDGVSEGAWPSVVQRYVEVIPKLVRLPASRLVRLDFETRAVAVREGRRHTTEPKVLAAIDHVLSLLDAAALGKEASKEEWTAAWAAAAWAAEEAEEEATAKAAWAASAGTAASAAKSAAKSAAAAAAAEETALGASWDRIASAMLSAWEAAV